MISLNVESKKNGTYGLTYKTVTDSEDKLMATKEQTYRGINYEIRINK